MVRPVFLSILFKQLLDLPEFLLYKHIVVRLPGILISVLTNGVTSGAKLNDFSKACRVNLFQDALRAIKHSFCLFSRKVPNIPVTYLVAIISYAFQRTHFAYQDLQHTLTFTEGSEQVKVLNI